MSEDHDAGQQRPVKRPADRRGMTGLGSFGKPAALIERLHQILARYGASARQKGGLPEGACPGHALQSLIERLTTQMQVPGRHSALRHPRVAGFYIYREGADIAILILTSEGAFHFCAGPDKALTGGGHRGRGCQKPVGWLK